MPGCLFFVLPLLLEVLCESRRQTFMMTVGYGGVSGSKGFRRFSFILASSNGNGSGLWLEGGVNKNCSCFEISHARCWYMLPTKED